MKRFYALLAAGMLALGAPSIAAPDAAFLQERLKAAMNDVVTDVRAAETPSEKREILHAFLERMDRGLQKAQALHSLSPGDKKSLSAFQGTMQGYQSELDGLEGYDRVDDAGLDDFAGYMQQNLEQ